MKRISLMVSFVAFVFASFIALCYATPLSYFYCLTRENAWITAETLPQLENRLIAFYSKEDLETRQSSWGEKETLKDDEQLTRYLVFGKETLDVIHTRDGNIVAFQPSYK